LPHVLFDGDIRQHPALRSLFWQWGVTVGSLAPDHGGFVPATVEECDAVLYLAGESVPAESGSSAMPDGAEAEGVAAAAAAPLLVVGSGPVPGTPWVSIPDPGPGGSRLKAALQSCQDRSRGLRGEPESRHDQDQFRNFLGHELRSPLTAIKTALTAMEKESDKNSGSDRMFKIAQRNLDRLAETVEWSQELLSLAEAPPTVDLGPVCLAALQEAMGDHLAVQLKPGEGGREVLTDPRLLGLLAGQMERVLVFALPGGRPVFRLQWHPEENGCRLTAEISPAAKSTAFSRVSRMGVTGGDRDRAGWNQLELEHLVRMLISPHLLQMLGVRPRIHVDDQGAVVLTVVLARWSGTCSPSPETTFAV
jgi:hypothetical protein